MEKAQQSTVLSMIGRINLIRLNFILILIFAVESMFLFYVERIRLLNATGEMETLITVSYTLHLTLTLFVIMVFFYSYHLLKKKDYLSPIVSHLPIIVTLVVLTFSAVISLFDQLTTGHVTVFSVKLLMFGLLLFIKPPYNFIIYTIPYSIFVVGIFLFQDNSALRLTHLINGTAIYLGIMVTSHYFYKHKFNEIKYRVTLRKMNKKLESLATLDPLTNLPNRRFFDKQVAYEKAISRRYKTKTALLLIDIDDFKEINDTYGHHAGDQVLVKLAQILQSNIRESDVVARWGGEEFIIMLSHTPLEGAEILATRLLDTIQYHRFKTDQGSIEITISIGIGPLYAESSFDLSYETIDKALYQSKDNGKNQYTTKTSL